MHWKSICVSSLALSMVFATACVSSNETKVAAANTSAALGQLGETTRMFRQDLDISIDNTIDLVRRVAIARGVQNSMKTQVEAEKKGDLTAAARSLERFRAEYRSDIDQLLGSYMGRLTEVDKLTKERAALKSENAEAKKIDDRLAQLTTKPSAAVDDYFTAKIGKLKKAADSMRALDAATADELVKIADSMAGSSGSQAGFRTAFSADLQVLLTLVKTKYDVTKNLGGFDSHVAALRGIHSQIEEWVMTDVNVSGKQIAELIEKNQETLGLGAPAK